MADEKAGWNVIEQQNGERFALLQYPHNHSFVLGNGTHITAVEGKASLEYGSCVALQ
jgi:hypothetical protein